MSWPRYLAARPLVNLADAPHDDVGEEVHAQLAAAQPSIQPVIDVILALLDGLKQLLALVQMLPHAPLEQAHEPLDRLVLAPGPQFGKVHPAPARLSAAAPSRVIPGAGPD